MVPRMGHNIDYNGVVVLWGQQHADPAKIDPSTPLPPLSLEPVHIFYNIFYRFLLGKQPSEIM